MKGTKQAGTKQAGTIGCGKTKMTSLGDIGGNVVTKGEYKYAESGKRLKAYYIAHWRKSEEAFCDAMEIGRDELTDYFTGKRDPLYLALQLIAIGVDLHWIVKGVHRLKTEELLMIEELRKRGIDNLKSVCRLLDDAHRCKNCGVTEKQWGDRLAWLLTINRITSN